MFTLEKLSRTQMLNKGKKTKQKLDNDNAMKKCVCLDNVKMFK